LQSDQQKLLEMKDNELNAVQQRLAQVGDAEQAARASGLPWVLGGAALLVLALLAGWWMRRRPARTPSFRPVAPEPSPLAAAFAEQSPQPVDVPKEAPAVAPPPPPAPAVAVAPSPLREPRTVSSQDPLPSSGVPTWHAASSAKGSGVPPISPVDGAVADDNV